jgi:hypothetical protein
VNHLRRFPLLCFLLASLAITGFCLVSGAIELLVVAGVLAAISWFVTEGPRGRTLPRWVSNVLVLGLLVNMLLEAQVTPQELPRVLGRFTVFLTLVKMYERRTARDHGQLMGLSLLLMLIGSAQMPPPLFFGLVLLTYLGLGLYCVLLYQLYAAHERLVGQRRRSGSLGIAATRPSTGRRVGLQLRLLAVGTGLATVAVSLGIFLLFPRELGRGMFAPPASSGMSGGGVTGLSPSVDLQTGTRITASTQPVFTVRTVPPPGEPNPADVGGVLRLRAFALDRYDGNGRWSRSSVGSVAVPTRPGSEVSLIPSDVPPPEPPPQAWEQTYRFLRDTPDILHLGGPLRVRFDDQPRSLSFEQSTRRLRAVPDDRGGGARLRTYRIWSVPEPSPEVVRALTGGGFDDIPITGILSRRSHPATQEIRRVALGLLRDANAWDRRAGRRGRPISDLAAARVFADHLESGAFRYTLDLSDVGPLVNAPGQGDPIVRFLLDTRRGHCEYFAAAFVAMCQSVGIEARIVIGYTASEPGEEPGSHLVRARDAHAWAEVRSDDWTWTTFDPTPAGVVVARDPDDPTIGDRGAAIYDQFENAWRDRFVGFDSGLQSEIFGAIDRGRALTLGTFVARLREWASGVNRAFRFGPAGYVWLGIVAFAGVIAIVAFARWLARRSRIRAGLGLRGTRAIVTERYVRSLAFYFDMLDALAAGGIVKPDWQPPLAWAETVARRRPDLAGDVRRLTEAYYAGRYGGRLPGGDEQETLRATAADLARRVAQTGGRAGRRHDEPESAT